MGKTKFFLRYLGKREDDELKVHEEDEITSTILGPLDFLPKADMHRFWRQLLCSTVHRDFLSNASLDDIRIDLWTRRNAKNDGNSIEPDGVVTIKTTDGQTRILLLELKWRGPLSGDDQLHRQWTQFLNKSEQAQALHLFIAPEITAGASAPNDIEAGGNVWKSESDSRLVLLTWMRFRTILAEFMNEKTAIGRWARLADTFLDKVGINKFSGFSAVTSTISIPSLELSTFFWTQFSGFGVCGKLPFLPNFSSSPLFFANKFGESQ